MALLLATIMMISMAAAIPNMLTQGRREKEQEMVWRGNQYKRGIRRFVQKFGRYPTSLDDLTKPQNGIRYMRQAYKDPMNPDDGKWRFIYVTSGGALVGSTRYISLQQLALADQNGGVLPAAPANGANSAAGALGMGFGAGSTAPDSSPNAAANNQQNGSNTSASGTALSTTPQNLQAPGSTATSSNPFSTSPNLGAAQGMLSSQQAQPLGGDVIGGNIIGVGSTVDKPSIRFYRGGKKYKDWEFIYDPLIQTATIGGQQGTGIPGATTPGQPIGQPANPQSNPFGGPTQAPPATTTNPQNPGSTQPQ